VSIRRRVLEQPKAVSTKIALPGAKELLLEAASEGDIAVVAGGD
jgi:hypothetical protein